MIRYSQFNNVVAVSSERSLLYNSLSDRFILLSNKAKNDIKSAPDQLKIENSKLYNNLLSIGAVVENEISESKKLLEIVDKICGNKEEYYLHINPTIDCNFHCWYCYEEHKKGTLMNSETFSAVKLNIDRILDKKELKYFHLSFFGGEPLIGFNDIALPLIKYAKEKCDRKGIKFTCHFTSNAYLLTDEIIDSLKDYNCGFQITIDGSPEDHDKVRFPKVGEGSFVTIINNIKKLSESGQWVVLRINYTAKNLAGVSDIIRFIQNWDDSIKEKIEIDLQRVWQDRNHADNEDEIWTSVQALAKQFESTGYSCNDNLSPDYLRNPCYGDKYNYHLINYNGDVYKCTARDFNKENRCGILQKDGSIKWNEEYIAIRNKIKMSRKSCLNCSIAPLCGGGCRQKGMENIGNDLCLHGYTDEDIKNIVLSKFEKYYLTE